MKETLISFETAVLAKEKEFNEECLNYYMGSKRLFNSNTLKNNNKKEISKEKYSAPTLSLLQKWLREVHNINIEISWNSNLSHKYQVQIHNLEKFCVYDSIIEYNTYEEALEEGVYEGLKLIK